MRGGQDSGRVLYNLIAPFFLLDCLLVWMVARRLEEDGMPSTESYRQRLWIRYMGQHRFMPWRSTGGKDSEQSYRAMKQSNDR